jgi:hypothetical protein
MGQGAPCGAGGPPMEGGYDEGYGGGFDDKPTARTSTAPARARARSPVNDVDDDIPF